MAELLTIDHQISKLQHAREFLALARFCRYDHPATDCKIGPAYGL